MYAISNSTSAARLASSSALVSVRRGFRGFLGMIDLRREVDPSSQIEKERPDPATPAWP